MIMAYTLWVKKKKIKPYRLASATVQPQCINIQVYYQFHDVFALKKNRNYCQNIFKYLWISLA